MIATQPYRFMFIMDPYSTLNLETETSLLLMSEILQQGHHVHWIEPDQLSLDMNRLVGESCLVNSIDPFELGMKSQVCLDDFDVVLPRIDPPFNTNYLHLTYLLDHISPTVIQVNPGRSIRDANEKLFGLQWSEFMAPTITTMNLTILTRFLNLHKKIVVKPLEDCSGRGIELIDSANSHAERQLARMVLNTDGQTRYVTAQKYLDAVKRGDKRVFLVNGNPIGAVNRIPKKGSFLANIHQGATCSETSLTAKEAHIISEIRPRIVSLGLFLVGMDFIGETVTEINITSPSAVRQINAVSGKRLEKTIVTSMIQEIERKQLAQKAG